MEQSDKKYWELAEKWMNGTITPEEQKEFAAWYNAQQDASLEIPGDFAENEQVLESRIWQQIEEQAEPAVSYTNRRPLWRKLAVAAAVLIIAGAGIYALLNNKTQQPVIAEQVKAGAPVVIQPGSDKAILTLPDGSSIVLDDAQQGTLRQQDHVKVVKTDSGQLAYQAFGKAIAAEVTFHTLSIPRGGKYQLTLADGTKVWLNAASGIRFPSVFTGKDRVVELTGEAYFEVAKNAAMPFKVKVLKQGMPGTDKSDAEITVLGTHFNINAYVDEAAIKTTLVEGSVKVTNQRVNDENVIIKPGQQATMVAASGKSNAIQVKSVEVEEFIAWKEGLFRFRGMDIETVMRQVSRWYDVEVVYEGGITNQHFNGTIARDVPVSEVFKMLELTRTIHFETAGKKIIVKAGAREN